MKAELQAAVFYFGWCIFIAFVFGAEVAFVLESGGDLLWAAFIGLLTFGSHFMLWACGALAYDSRPSIIIQRDLSSLQARWGVSLPRWIMVTAMLGIFNAAWFFPIGVWFLRSPAGSSEWRVLGLTILCWAVVFGPTQRKIFQKCRDSFRGVKLMVQANTLHLVFWERGRQQDHRIGLLGLEVTADQDRITVGSGDQTFTLLAASLADSRQLVCDLQPLLQSAEPAGDRGEVPQDLQTLILPPST